INGPIAWSAASETRSNACALASARSLSATAPTLRRGLTWMSPRMMNAPTAIWDRIVKKVSGHSCRNTGLDFLAIHDLAVVGIPLLRIAVRANDEVGLGDARIRQGCDGADIAVLLPQLVDRTPVQRTRGAGGDAGGLLPPLRTQVGAQVALAHLLGLRVELRRGVRAGRLAVAATNALIGVDGDDAVLPLVHRGRRADLRADQVLSVIAGDRCVVGEGLVVKHPVGEVPVPAGVLHDPAPVGTQRGVVLVLAGDLAGLAADAQALVEVETQPLVFSGSVLLSHVCLTFGLS